MKFGIFFLFILLLGCSGEPLQADHGKIVEVHEYGSNRGKYMVIAHVENPNGMMYATLEFRTNQVFHVGDEVIFTKK